VIHPQWFGLPVFIYVKECPMAEDYHEADTVTDTPITAEEGSKLLTMLRGCEPEDFTFEVTEPLPEQPPLPKHMVVKKFRLRKVRNKR